MYIVGLTGGIGCGKSTIARFFSALGVPCVDADQIARDVVAVGEPALAQITAHFGSTILQSDGTLNRPRLREMIFNVPDQREWLNQLLHPLIRQHMLDACNSLSAPYCLLMIPLLFENHLETLVDRVLVIDIPECEQIQRTVQRDQVTPDQVRKIMASQYPRQQRLLRAHDIISNRDAVSDIYLQPIIQQFHHDYLRYARIKNRNKTSELKRAKGNEQ